jgi:hypothetical protein
MGAIDPPMALIPPEPACVAGPAPAADGLPRRPGPRALISWRPRLGVSETGD